MPSDTLRVDARVERLPDLMAWVAGHATDAALDDRARYAVQLALEEAFVNVCHHAYADAAGPVELAWAQDGDRVRLDVIDWGPPFDPLARAAPDLTADVMDRPIGGLGVHLIRQLAAQVAYAREADRNVLTMAFDRAGRPG